MARMSSAATSASSSMSEIARASARGSPASTRSASAERVTRLSGCKQLPGDDEPLHFARAFTDRRQLDVAKELLRRIVLDEAVTSVDLHCVFRRAYCDLARIQLGH